MRRPLQSFALLAAVTALCLSLAGCLVAGYSSGGGFWMWPGSLVLTLVLILVYFLMRHR